MPETTFIYGLLDPRTNNLHYVGQSKHPSKRLKQHVADANRVDDIRQVLKQPEWVPADTRRRWLFELKSQDKQPSLVILESLHDSDDEEVRRNEQQWIDRLLSEGHPLVNRQVISADENTLSKALELGRRMFG